MYVETFFSKKLFYNRFNSCIRFYCPVSHRTDMKIVNPNADFYNRKITFSTSGPRVDVRFADFSEERTIVEFHEKLRYSYNNRTSVSHDDELQFKRYTVALFTFCRMSYLFYEKTGIDLFDKNRFRWFVWKIPGNSIFHYWPFDQYISLYLDYDDIGLVLKEFIIPSRSVAYRLFGYLNEIPCKTHYGRNFRKSLFHYIVLKDFYLPCDATYKRETLPVEFSTKHDNIVVNFMKGDKVVETFELNSMKELMKYMMQRNSMDVKISLPFGKEQETYFQRKKQEIENLLGRLQGKLQTENMMKLAMKNASVLT